MHKLTISTHFCNLLVLNNPAFHGPSLVVREAHC